jgi:isoquinoline 1-oxidoreductase
MSTQFDNNTRFAPVDEELEFERYELRESPRYAFDLDRRDFFKLLGCGVVVLLVRERVDGQESGRRGRGFGGRGGGPREISAWLHIGEDGVVTAYSGKVDVGQNSRTSLTQAVAEELHLPVTSIRMLLADTDVVPYDAGTFGSGTSPRMWPQLLSVAAAAREALIGLAAERWNVGRETLVAADGKVTNPATQEAVTYSELTKGQQITATVGEGTPLAPHEKWTVAGTSVPKVNGREFVTGKHEYASDVKRPGMLHGKVLRPVAFGATLAKLDASAGESMEGVTVVRDGDFVAVVAANDHAAQKALDLIKADWITSPQPSGSELFTLLRQEGGGSGRGGGRGGGGRTTGSIEEGLKQADHQLKQTYTIAYIAHAPLEPRAAVAEWKDGKLTVWTGTQRPFGVRGELAQAFRIPEDRVRVIVPDTGSGYGGKHTGEAAVEAARLAKAAGKPVKLVWTREEEFTWAYARPAGVIEVTAGVKQDGTLTAWDFHNYNSGGSAIGTPYEVPNQRNQSHSGRSPLRQGSYRALAATANHFAREVAMDELAHAVGMDPLAFRLKNLSDPRLRTVLQAAADAFGWGKEKPAADHGFGIAVGTEKNSCIGTCADVAVDRQTGRVRVTRVVAAFECGAVINPEHLKNQIEGSIVMGLGGALYEALDFDNGRITNPRFSDYRVPRFRDAPRIEVVLVNRPDVAPIGAGETPIVGIAPAVSNAIFAATGVRLRGMPMVKEGWLARL